MRKTLLYLLLLIVLGFGVYYFLFSKKDALFSVDEAGFTVRDTAAIGKLFIAGPGGESVTVVRTDSGWMVNNKYRALPSTVNIVLKTLAKQAAQYPVPETQHNNIVTMLAGKKVTVEIYDHSGKKMRAFFLGGETKDVDGSYMLMKGAERPYVVQVPGFVGYLTPNYPYTLENWRDRTVINMAADKIKTVSVQYPDYPLNSFVVNQQNGKVTVTGDPTIVSNRPFNERRARFFVTYFGRGDLNVEGYLVGAKDMDTMLKVMPKYCVLDITGQQGQHQHVDIYWSPITRRSKNMMTPNADVPDNEYDADRYFAVMNNYKDTAIIQSNVFNKIFRKAYEFYEADAKPEEEKDPRKGQIKYTPAEGVK